jgi:putative FmdB family regulatory protein
MPFYDYECKHGHVFEEMCSMSDRKRKKECPECGEKGSVIISVKGKHHPHFGNQDTLWNMRERKRISETDKNGKYRNKFSGHI